MGRAKTLKGKGKEIWVIGRFVRSVGNSEGGYNEGERWKQTGEKDMALCVRQLTEAREHAGG
jgi:hypothetical protein